MEQTIIKVQFFTTIDGKTDFYFFSLAAIFEHFTSEQVGCSLYTLWRANITIDSPKSTRNCVVSREPIYSKPQINKVVKPL